ncbi:MAG: hypothetical protein M5U21_01845 [Fimbriimonadaceae bacterium]|nr:hypothetical protein [Fimbriimonadaceae bacterium]MCZ7579556.1 hypothetical protein [Fimbriimonadaceae bacterium]
MVVSVLLLGAAIQTGVSPTGHALTFGNNTFYLQTPAGAHKHSLEAVLKEEAPRTGVLFRKDDVFAVWDSRGLSVRNGNHVKTTRMPDAARSPKLFTAEQIGANDLAIRAKQRTAGATALSGAVRLDDKAYFLLRWHDVSGALWLEALFAVDLTSENPAPYLVGRLEGRSIDFDRGASPAAIEPIEARKPVPLDDSFDRLFVVSDGIAAFSKLDDGRWGLAGYDPSTREFYFKIAGANLRWLTRCGSRLTAFVEGTAHGSLILGRFDIPTGSRRYLMETRGSIRLLDRESPWLSIAHEETNVWLHDLAAGTKLLLPDSAGLARVGPGVLVWSPQRAPTFAAYYDTTRAKQLAQWNQVRTSRSGTRPFLATVSSKSP